jgi:hypothetical protein
MARRLKMNRAMAFRTRLLHLASKFLGEGWSELFSQNGVFIFEKRMGPMRIRFPIIQICRVSTAERDDEKMIRLFLPHLRAEVNGIHFVLKGGVGKIGPSVPLLARNSRKPCLAFTRRLMAR